MRSGKHTKTNSGGHNRKQSWKATTPWKTQCDTRCETSWETSRKQGGKAPDKTKRQTRLQELAGVRHSATDSKDKLGDKAGRQVSKVVNGKHKRETK